MHEPDDRLRLCFVAQEHAGVTHPRTGGIGNWMAAVTAGLASRGHEVHSVVPRAEGAPVPLSTPPAGVTVHALPRLRAGAWQDVLNHELWPRRVARHVADLGSFDAVVAQDFGGPAVSYARHPRTSPLVTHLHNSLEQIREASPDRHSGRAAPILVPLQVRRERRQAAGSDAIAGCSAAVLDDATRRWSLAPRLAGVVHSMIDVDEVRRLGEGDDAVALPDDDVPLVVFSGRLYEVKGVQELVSAMRRLWERGRDARLVLAGSDGGFQGGSMLDRLRSLAGEHAHRMVHVGALEHSVLFPLLRRAAVVAMPSYWEALPLALVESLALGCPIVTTSGHGADDVVTHDVDALVIPPRDDEQLAAAIERLLSDPSLAAALGRAARDRSDYFSVDEGIARFEGFYGRVAELRT